LLGKLTAACAKAGLSNSNLVIDFGAGRDAEEVDYLQSAMLARTDQVSPPFQPGYRVKAKKKMVAPDRSNGYRRSSHPRELKGTLTIEKVFYRGDKGWALRFVERTKATADTESEYAEDGGESWWVPLDFPAEDFELAHEPLEAIHQKILDVLFLLGGDGDAFERFVPENLARWLKVPSDELIPPLEFLVKAGYFRRIKPWWTQARGEDKNCHAYEMV